MRYATDSTNMQVWISHNATRYVFVATDGPVIVWDYPGSEFLSAHLDLIDEMRVARSWMYMFAGDHYDERAADWAGEIADLVATYGGGNRRLALDHAGPAGFRALTALGIDIRDGEEVMERARAIKSPDEIDAMRCAVAAAEASIDVMREALHPGMTEQRLWSTLHAENIARGGEWIETRLLVSGPRTNPWFQECSSRVIEDGDLVAFDTDLIGPYGYCVDMSRTWRAGDGAPTPFQRDTWRRAVEQIERNTGLVEPGRSFRELTFAADVPDPDRYRHYSVLYHGVGLADEWPSIYFPEAWDQVGFDGVLEPGMVLCVEAYVGPRAGGEGVKLEQQVLVTETGHEVLTPYPLDL
jgi:Xaa-Pro aminopeptidase